MGKGGLLQICSDIPQVPSLVRIIYFVYTPEECAKLSCYKYSPWNQLRHSPRCYFKRCMHPPYWVVLHVNVMFLLDFPNNTRPHNQIGEKVSYFNVLTIQMGSLFKCGFCLADQNMSWDSGFPKSPVDVDAGAARVWIHLK